MNEKPKDPIDQEALTDRAVRVAYAMQAAAKLAVGDLRVGDMAIATLVLAAQAHAQLGSTIEEFVEDARKTFEGQLRRQEARRPV